MKTASYAGRVQLGGADEILDCLEVVHVFVRRSHADGSALLEVG